MEHTPKKEWYARRVRQRNKRVLACLLFVIIVLIPILAVSCRRQRLKPDSAENTNIEETQEQTETQTEEITENVTEDPLADCPASLVEFMQKYPEATQFVLDYAENKDREMVIDLSDEVKKGELPMFLQWDVRWGYRQYGDDFMAVNGCGPTCLSMVYCGLTGDTRWYPYAVAQMADERGYFVPGSGTEWTLMDSGARELGLEVHSVTLAENDILVVLEMGLPIIASVGPGDFTDNGHFIVLAGVNENGSIHILDPNSRINSEKEWDIQEVIPQINGLWAYSYSK
ncbi:MAG: papain-like cysteine protease family protein [Eubacteriales bacterium]|nr:papain-like cysteine protease family protein [Eubacteriales bacterium]